MMWESLCYLAQQAAEKALKAVLIHLGIEPPRTHLIEKLVLLLSENLPQPPELTASVRLTDYAIETKYPGREDLVTEDEYREAIRLAEAVVHWAAGIIGPGESAELTPYPPFLGNGRALTTTPSFSSTHSVKTGG